MNQTLSLYRLQQADSRNGRATARLQAIGKLLEDDAALRQAASQAEAAEKARQAAEYAMRQAEQKVQHQRIKVEQTEASLYSGASHNPKELQDLQNDVAALKRHLATLDDRQLEAMLADEETEAARQAAQAALQIAQARADAQNHSLHQERAGLEKELARLEAERQAIAIAIPAPLMELYDQLRQARGGVAVAAVSESACAACGSSLTPAEQQAARSPSQMARCPSCGRILYGS
jgi:predicted  nucleic acid-binding Zn-ribbon protein